MQKGAARSVDMLMDAEIDYPWNLMLHSVTHTRVCYFKISLDYG